MELIKSLSEGREVECNAKYKNPIITVIKCPIIFLSNYPPPKDINGFVERFCVVEFKKGKFFL